MISLSKLQRLSKLRPLTAKEKAILCYWNRADGKFNLTNGSSKMSEMLLSFSNVYSDQELESVISPMASERESEDFFYWTGIINITLDYDLKSNIFFQKTLSLLNEKSLSFYKLPRIEIMAKRYSVTLNKEVDVFEINDEISNSFIMFYRLLVYTITNHILLSNAFSPKDDFFCVQALIHMTDIRRNTSDDNSTSWLINGLIVMLQEENQGLINDYLDYVKRKYKIEYFWSYISDQWRRSKIIESVGNIINLYYPTKPTPKSKEDTIFSEIKEFTHGDI